MDSKTAYEDKYGAVVDRSKQGEVTLSLDGVTIAVPYDATKPVISDARAVLELTNATIAVGTDDQTKEGGAFALRLKRAMAEWKVPAYADYLVGVPKKQQAAVQAKMDYWAVTLEKLRADDTVKQNQP